MFSIVNRGITTVNIFVSSNYQLNLLLNKDK